MFQFFKTLPKFTCHRTFSTVSPIDYVGRELFHPDQWHIRFLNRFLVIAQTQTHMPWDWTIMSTALILRTLIHSPLYVYAEKNLSKVMHVSLDCVKTKQLLLKKLQSSSSFKLLTPMAAQKYYNRMARQVFIKTCERNHCHPLKSAATAIVQLPFWLSFSFTLRYMCGYGETQDYGWCYLVPGMVSDGLNVVCTDLTLPIAVLAVGLVNVELMYLRQLRPPESITAPERYTEALGYIIGRGVGWLANGFIFYVSLLVPKAMVIYWLTSSVHQFLSHLIVMHPSVRRLLGIWPRPNEGVHPYRVLFDQAKSRYRLLRLIYRKQS